MIELTRETLKQDSGIYMHDAKIEGIRCDYIARTVQVELDPGEISSFVKAGREEKITLEFQKVKFLSVTMDEPWGGGIHIAAWRFKSKCGDKHPNHESLSNCFSSELILNSGDTIKVLSEILKYDERLREH